MVLVAVLLSLEGTRREITSTRDELGDTNVRVGRLKGDLQPLRRSSRRAAAGAVGAAGEVPLITRALEAADLPSSLGAVRSIAGNVEDADLASVLERVRALAGAATPVVEREVPRLVAALERLGAADGASQRECDRRLVRDAPGASGQLGCVLQAIADLRQTLHRSVRVQRGSRRYNRATVELLRESLGVQREILARVRSIDAKLPDLAPGVR